MTKASYEMSNANLQKDGNYGTINKGFQADTAPGVTGGKTEMPPSELSFGGADGEKDAEGTDSVEDIYCGVGSCRPSFMQGCKNMACFSLFYSMVGLMTSALITYINSQITTLEKHFNLSSSMSGFLMSCNDIGYLATTLLVSYYTRRVHIPRTLAIFTILYGVSGLLCTLAYFVTSDQLPRLPRDTPAGMNQSMLASSSSGQAPTCQNWTTPASTGCQETSKESKILFDLSEKWKTLAICIISIGMILQGVAKSPRQAFLLTYVDDNVEKTKTAMYLGNITGISIFGPALAYGLGGLFNSIYITLEETHLSPRDPRWLGAWWLGFLLFGGAGIVVALPLFFFPRRMRKQKVQNVIKAKETEEEDVQCEIKEKKTEEVVQSVIKEKKTEKDVQGVNKEKKTDEVVESVNKEKKTEELKRRNKWLHDFKDLMKAVLRLVRNPLFMCMAIAHSLNMLAVSGAMAFLPKYMETQFSLTAGNANIYIGATQFLAAPIGTIIGGLFTARWKLSPLTCLKLLIGLVIVSTGVTSLGFVFGCEQPVVLKEDVVNSSGVQHTSQCVQDCHCDPTNYFPVCGQDGNTYFSPCHAGCTIMDSKIFANCSCLTTKDNHTAIGGICVQDCGFFIPFLSVYFIAAFVATLGLMPGVIAFVRSVKDEDKPLAASIYAFMGTLLGWLPGPVLTGALVDTTCKLWKTTCTKTGACALYDIELFRFRFHLLTVGLRFIIIGLYLIALAFAMYSTRWLFQPHEDEVCVADAAKEPVKEIIKFDEKSECKEQTSEKRQPISISH